MSENAPENTYEQSPAPDFYVLKGNKVFWNICRIHNRSLTFIEMQQQQCHWCEPSFAYEYLVDGKTKNPCYNHEAHRPFTKEEMNERIKEGRTYKRKGNG